jgi:hypothetical protein
VDMRLVALDTPVAVGGHGNPVAGEEVEHSLVEGTVAVDKVAAGGTGNRRRRGGEGGSPQKWEGSPRMREGSPQMMEGRARTGEAALQRKGVI